MTPPRNRRQSDAEPTNPLVDLQDDVKMILLHVAGGLDPDGKVVIGLSGEMAALRERVTLLERIFKWAVSIGSALIVGAVSTWAHLTGSPPTHP